MGDDPLPFVVSCLKRIFRWRVPPNWSISDWRNEMRAEAACAAWQAVCDYDPSLSVPPSLRPARYELEFRLHPVPISMHGGCLPLALRVAANPFE